MRVVHKDLMKMIVVELKRELEAGAIPCFMLQSAGVRV